MNQLQVFVQGVACGTLVYLAQESCYILTYNEGYQGPPVSLTFPVEQKTITFRDFPDFFSELLPHHFFISSTLPSREKIFQMLVKAGHNLVGQVTLKTKE